MAAKAGGVGEEARYIDTVISAYFKTALSSILIDYHYYELSTQPKESRGPDPQSPRGPDQTRPDNDFFKGRESVIQTDDETHPESQRHV